MGELAIKYADKCIITNDNPRTEAPEKIAADIEAGMKASSESAYEVISQDWVLVAGKGHEATQTIGATVVPFSDREQVALALGLENPRFTNSTTNEGARA